jgi:hypothetical protein
METGLRDGWRGSGNASSSLAATDVDPDSGAVIVFDDVIDASGNAAYTSSRFDRLMASRDQIALQVVIDQVSAGSATFDLWIETSCDSIHWLQVTDTTQTWPPPESHAGVAGDLQIASLATTSANTQFFSDARLGITRVGTSYGGPLLAYVRLAIKIGGASARVRVHYFGR